MKRIAIILISITLLSLSGTTLSWWSKWNSCRDSATSCQDFCSDCQCSDPGYGRNKCMSDYTYCEAFGNIGKFHDYE